MEELVKRLRETPIDIRCAKVMREAADAIEQLDKDLERAKEYEAFWEKEATEALRRFQVAVASKPRWIPVEERLPEPMKHVLLFVRRTGREFNHDPFISTGHISMDKVSWWCSHDGDCSIMWVKVSHWMPLPEPPEEET